MNLRAPEARWDGWTPSHPWCFRFPPSRWMRAHQTASLSPSSDGTPSGGAKQLRESRLLLGGPVPPLIAVHPGLRQRLWIVYSVAWGAPRDLLGLGLGLPCPLLQALHLRACPALLCPLPSGSSTRIRNRRHTIGILQMLTLPLTVVARNDSPKVTVRWEVGWEAAPWLCFQQPTPGPDEITTPPRNRPATLLPLLNHS